MISIAIVGLITSMGVLSFSGHNDRKNFDNSIKLLEQKIIETKISALAGQLDNNESTPMYGLQLGQNKKEYFTYFDINGNCQFDNGETIKETVTLPDQVEFISSSVNGFCFQRDSSVDHVCAFGGNCSFVGNYTLYLQALKIKKGASLSLNSESGNVSLEQFDL